MGRVSQTDKCDVCDVDGYIYQDIMPVTYLGVKENLHLQIPEAERLFTCNYRD